MKSQYEKRSSDIIKGDPIPPGSLALLHLPHRKGTTPFRGRQAAASELAESDRGSLTFWSWGRSLETGDLFTGIRERESVSDHWKDERKEAEAGGEHKSKTASQPQRSPVTGMWSWCTIPGDNPW